MSKVESKEDSLEIGTCIDFKPGQKNSTPAPGNNDYNLVAFNTKVIISMKGA